ncbi:MAG: hypothetical protein KIT74_06675 [Fimbriimonadales bacterium]|nr:hypothetical protein [Fimbriimonadales bacterium]
MIAIVLASLFPIQLLEPVAIIEGGVQHEVSATYESDTWSFEWKDGHYRVARDQSSYKLSPPAELQVLFVAPPNSQPARTNSQPNIVCVISGELHEGPANAIRLPDGTIWSFGDALGGVYSSGGRLMVRAEFTESISALSIRSIKPDPIPRKIPANANAVAASLARFSDHFGGAAHSGAPIKAPLPESEGEAAALATLAALCGEIIELDGPAWQPWKTRTGQGLPKLARIEAEPTRDVPEIIAIHSAQGGLQSVTLCVFNLWDRVKSVRIDPEAIGLRPATYVAFDFWRNRNLGAFAGPLILTLPARSARVVIIREQENRPQLIGTDVHVAGVSQLSLHEEWIEDSQRLKCSVRAPSGKPFNVFISQGVDHIFESPSIKAISGSAAIHSNNGFYRIELAGDAGELIEFEVKFESHRDFISTNALDITATAATPWAATFTLQGPQRFPNAGYYLFKNDALLGYSADFVLSDEEINPLAHYSYVAVPVGFSGTPGEPKFMTLNPGWPVDIALHRTPFIEFGPKFAAPKINQTLIGETLTLDGSPISGMSLAAGSFVEYIFSRTFVSLEATAFGLGEGAKIRILLDGIEVWNSDALKHGERKPFRINLSDAYGMRIEVSGGDAALLTPQLRAKPRP